jgi:hypothetical protein
MFAALDALRRRVRQRRRAQQLGERELPGIVEVLLATEEDHLVGEQCLPDRRYSAWLEIAAELDSAAPRRAPHSQHSRYLPDTPLRQAQDPAAWSTHDVGEGDPGLGNFLIKVGGRTGIPIPVDRTPVEWALNDTNKQWRDAD